MTIYEVTEQDHELIRLALKALAQYPQNCCPLGGDWRSI